MKNKLDHALALAAEGFHVFPLIEGGKLPAIDGYPTKATRDPEQIKRWWTDPVLGLPFDRNIGISTTHYGDHDALLVVDIDNKGDKHGDDEIKKLAAQGMVLPKTRATRTPSGGYHFFYRVPVAVRQGANTLARGVDTRSYGGFVVGPGSVVSLGEYQTASAAGLCDAPQWVLDKCGTRHQEAKNPVPRAGAAAVDPERARARAREYLEALEPETEGGRNEAGYRVAAKLKDLGVTEMDCASLMAEHWNCTPMLDDAELGHVVGSAYRYGKNAPGVTAPEAQFPPLSTNPEQPKNVDDHPFEEMNKQYAYTLLGGDYLILWNTKDPDGKETTKFLAPGAFKTKFPGIYMPRGKQQVPIAQAWMDWPGRRSYDGLVFTPGKDVPPRFYNLWRGFAVQPLGKDEKVPKEWQAALDAFLDHALVNVCQKNEALYRWLIGFFAHLIQRPWEKPLVALVFRGSKGVGKNALVDRVGYLLKEHFAVVANGRYLTGQFNSHMEHSLFLVFDEAFWSGDKKAEGQLKDVITSDTHFIERKGYEPYKAPNRTRIGIIGNEDWLAPSSHDERRFAVFDVSDGRKQDRAFFQTMRERMERGGYRLLLRYLLDFDLTGIELNEAPSTKGLLDQKIASLEPLDQWWYESLREGQLSHSDFDEGWPNTVETGRFRGAIKRYFTDRNIHSRVPDSSAIGIALKRCAPSVRHDRSQVEGSRRYVYLIPSLEQARAEWEAHIGHKVKWE